MSDATAQPTTTRRTALAGLGAGGLGLVLAARGRDASAQEATPAAHVSRYNHPLVGAWRYEQGPLLLYGVFHEDGAYLEYEDGLGVGIGGWQTTGERTARLVVVYQTVPEPLARDEVFAPDYVPMGHEFRPGVFIKRFPDVEVDEDGTTMMAGRTVKGTAEGRNPDGSLGVLFTDEQSTLAHRLVDDPRTAEATPAP